MRIHELGHVNLYVKDLDASRHFYRDILGFREIVPKREVIKGVAYSGSDRTHHEMFLVQSQVDDPAPVPAEPRLGVSHFGFKIGTTHEELESAYRQVKAAGVPIVAGSNHGYMESLHLLDPDGNQVELYVDLDSSSWKSDPDAALPVEPVDRPIELDGDHLATQDMYVVPKDEARA